MQAMTDLDAALTKATSKAPATCQLRDARRDAAYLDARRAMDICNACRYCEGFCAVFPAMTLRREFKDSDLDYLANLCHNCKGCFYSCQYAPPHAFGVNVPKLFAELRVVSYEKYAWPQQLARLFRNNGTVLSLATVTIMAAVLIATMLAGPGLTHSGDTAPGAFYRVIPWAVMSGVAAITLGFSVLALAMGGARFWRATGGRSPAVGALREATADVLTLRNLGGGGGGCNDIGERFSVLRRRFHHAMFYGFMLCFASTTVATVYDHFLGRVAPYPLLSLPVQLGLWGGCGLLIGTAGLCWIKVVADPGPAARTVLGADFALLMLLAMAAATGLLLLGLRGSPAMPALLAVHLGTILTLFLFLPYSKMVHGLYRSLALLRAATERRAG